MDSGKPGRENGPGARTEVELIGYLAAPKDRRVREETSSRTFRII
jgi:hypothetical protein